MLYNCYEYLDFSSFFLTSVPRMGVIWPIFNLLRMDSVGFADVQSEDELYDFDTDMDPPNWQQLVSREVLMGLKPYEIKRQEVINGEMGIFF